MKRKLLLSKILLFISSFSYASEQTSISLYNFINIDADVNNEIVNNASTQISQSFIYLMKKDMVFTKDLVFQSNKDLDKLLDNTKDKLISEIQEELKNGFMSGVSRENFSNIISNSVKGPLNPNQISAITDSLIISITKTTKDIAKDMFLSNVISSGEPQEITSEDLDDFISSNTEESISGSNYIRLLSSANNKDTDFVIISNCKISRKEAVITLDIFNFSDFSFFDTVSSKNSPEKIHILLKDIEFKLFEKLGILLDDKKKFDLSNYNFNEFSKVSNSLYCSTIFNTQDIKELAFRMQVRDPDDFVNNHYLTFISQLNQFDYNYRIKLNNNNNFYRVYSIESVSDSSVIIKVSKNSNWLSKDNPTKNLIFSNDPKSKKRSIVEIDFSNLQSIEFIN